MFDILIHGGHDSSGLPAFRADVALQAIASRPSADWIAFGQITKSMQRASWSRQAWSMHVHGDLALFRRRSRAGRSSRRDDASSADGVAWPRVAGHARSHVAATAGFSSNFATPACHGGAWMSICRCSGSHVDCVSSRTAMFEWNDGAEQRPPTSDDDPNAAAGARSNGAGAVGLSGGLDYIRVFTRTRRNSLRCAGNHATGGVYVTHMRGYAHTIESSMDGSRTSA
jgi:hypothetical protein